MLTKEHLSEIFDFDVSSGSLKWKTFRSGIKLSKSAGHKSRYGYHVVMIDGKQYLVHRLMWVLHYGYIQDHMRIDHINGIRDDNRIENLRLATPSMNAQNKRKAQINNKVGVLGVHKIKSGRYRASIQTNRKVKNLGTFDTPEEAHNAYLEAKRLLHNGCTI